MGSLLSGLIDDVRIRSASLRTGFVKETCLRPPGSMALPAYE
ncbi:MAG TPA: hypothetical protein VMW72_05335 [Sedimentisphaerales bacterium]|nr:hypothetical protein [Sedimentisphaerales bacterium]